MPTLGTSSQYIGFLMHVLYGLCMPSLGMGCLVHGPNTLQLTKQKNNQKGGHADHVLKTSLYSEFLNRSRPRTKGTPPLHYRDPLY